MNAPGGLTVLRCTGNALATKRWVWNKCLGQWSKVSYAAGARFVPVEHQVADLAGLVAVLDAVRHDPGAFVVRGALTEEAAEAVAADPRHCIRRRKHHKGSITPTLAEVPRAWLMVDIDGWPLRPSDDLASDPLSAIDHAIGELLPEPFHDAECWWQLSASAGFVPGLLKAHLWFWLSEPANNDHIKAVLKQHAPGVDRAPYSAAQPHFIADPIIEGGYDPLPARMGWRRGLEAAVALPALAPVQAAPRIAGTGTGRSGSVLDALAVLGDSDGLEGFHAPLRTATMRYARDCARSGARDDGAIKAELLTAMHAAPRRPERGNLESYGPAYLQHLIDGAFALLAGQSEIQTMRPHHQPAVQTLDDARAALRGHVGGFFDRARRWNDRSEPGQSVPDPDHAALIVGVGAGKSTAGYDALPGYLAEIQVDGEPGRFLWAVPTHKLGNQALEAMERRGISAAVMRGRDAEVPGTADPENYIEAEKMCRNLDAVKDALLVHANVETSVCGSGRPGEASCPWRTGPDQCAFQQQKVGVNNARVVITAHDSLFYALPKEVHHHLSAVIVDESFWQAGLNDPRDVFLDSFTQEPLTHPVLKRVKTRDAARQTRDDAGTADLHAASALAQKGFAQTAEGELVSKATMQAAGLTAAQCASAYALEWGRMVEGVINPGQSARERRKALARAAGNAAIPRRAAIWKALQELLEGDATHTGRLEMGERDAAEGALRTIVLHSRRNIRDEVTKLPILLLDATMPLDIVRHYLPRVQVLAEVHPAAPHMKVHQVIGGWGKTSLCQNPKAKPDDAENKRRAGVVRDLADFVALNGGGDAGVITYEAIEKEFERPGIRTTHFNAFVGLDNLKDARSIFVIGRPLPTPRDVRNMALALTGLPVPKQDGQVETRGALMADGTGAAINVRTYADPTLEAIRVAITDAQLVQAVGRGRGVRREAGTPLDVFILADVVSPLPLNRVVRWEDVRPNVIQRMAARGLVLFSAADAARVYSDLFETPKAAEHAISRAGVFPPHSPKSVLIIGEWGGNQPLEVTYKPHGRGQQTRRALVAPRRLAGLAEFLTAALCLPVTVTVMEPPVPPAEPPPASPPAVPLPTAEAPPGEQSPPVAVPRPEVPPRPPAARHSRAAPPAPALAPGDEIEWWNYTVPPPAWPRLD